ncbi:MAG: minichromosome maintenance protein MCM [Candidatus Micrarchaeaceae archaeon]
MPDAVIEGIKSRFEDFFQKYYRDEVNELKVLYPNQKSLRVDIKELAKFDTEIAEELIERPDTIIESAREALAGMLGDVITEENDVYVRFFGQNVNTPLVMDVGSAYINKIIDVDALVVKRSEIIPRVKIGVYRCSYCGSVYKIRSGKDEVPEVCPECKRKSLKAVEEESKFVDLQKIAVQDPLEKLRGNTPTWQLEVWLIDDLVNKVIPGDRIDITGVLRIRKRRSIRGKIEKDLYTMYLDALSLSPKQKEFAEIAISEEEERSIIELSKDPQIFEKIWKSVVPSVYGHEEVKQSIVLQLFGGTPNKTLVDGGVIRSDIHILLIGDPGSAKTRILQTVTKLVPKGIYVSGKSVTGGGMTAVAERDEFAEGGWTLRAGALVLGSGGVVCIDEFDKIEEIDRAALHEALESQTISVAKAGIIATFNAKAAVLAAANPKYGRFDPNIYPSEQFDIPPTLLSRFDLIFPIKDIMDEELDKRIADYILVQHAAAGAALADIKGYKQVEAPPIDGEMLRKYIAYSKKNVIPRLSEEASKMIQDYYVELRKAGARQGAVPITPRQIEGLVRLAEASAKTRLDNVVTEKDAERAIALSEFMLKTLAVDRGGRRDIDTLLTGMPREKVDKINSVLNIIKNLEEKEASAKMQRIIEEAEKAGIDAGTTTKYINELEKSGDVFSPRPGIIKIVKRESE